MLVDRFSRRIDYVRDSVTDQCDLRCSYCLPKGFKDFEVPEHWLTQEELVRVVLNSFANSGPALPSTCAMLAVVTGIRATAVTSAALLSNGAIFIGSHAPFIAVILSGILHERQMRPARWSYASRSGPVFNQYSKPQ